MVTTATRPKPSVEDPVGNLISRAPVFVRSELTLRELAEVLIGDGVGCVLVRSHGTLAGIVSERDLAQALAEGADPDSERVVDVMSDDLVIVSADTPLGTVAHEMLDDEIRHLPILDNGVAIGVVSMREVLRAVLRCSEA